MERTVKYFRVLILCALALACGGSTIPLTGAGKTPQAPLAITFPSASSYGEDITGQTTYSIASLDFGAEAADRCIIAVAGSRANVARSVSSATIGGVAATIIVTANDTSGGADIATILTATVPTGTTGTVAVTFSGAMLRFGVGVFRMTGSANCATATDTQTDVTIGGSNDGTYTINVPAGGGAVSGFWVNPTSGTPTTTWTNLTESFDDSDIDGNALSGALTTTPNAALAVTATSAATINRMALAGASFAP